MPTETYSFDGSFTVPPGVGEVTVVCKGEGGGTGADGDQSNYEDGGDGGPGGLVEGTLNVNSGETLYIRINDDGGAGTGGYNALGDSGEGGGSADIRYGGTSRNDRVAVAAGGGGGGTGQTKTGGDGGPGGAGIGGDGLAPDGDVQEWSGKGGTQNSGGDSGEIFGDDFGAEDGSFGPGGKGASDSGNAGGGGGGGWYGGGGGIGGGNGGYGGGGGSNYTGGLDTVARNEQGTTYDHEVQISYQIAPYKPINVTQTVVGDDTIDLSWDDDPSGGDAENYRVEAKEDESAYSFVTNTSSQAYTYTADPATNTHRFRVRASNSVGSSSFGYTLAVDTDPTGLSVADISSSQVSLSWDAVRDAADYDVFRAETLGSAESDYTLVATEATSPYTDTGLEDGERYYYRVRAAYPGTDSQLTAEVNASTPLPAPTVEALDWSTPREVGIGYTLNDNSTDGDIRIERSADGGTTWTEVATITDLSATEYADTGLLDGQEYTYRLTRRTDHVEAKSATMSAITVLPAPTDLTTPTIGETSAEYAWTATHNQGQTRVEYRRAGEGDSWTTYETVGNETASATVDGLLNGERYEGRVVAQTDDAETEDK